MKSVCGSFATIEIMYDYCYYCAPKECPEGHIFDIDKTTCVRREIVEADPLKELHTFKFALTGKDLTYAACKTTEEGQPAIRADNVTRACVQECPDTEGNALSLDGTRCLTKASAHSCGEHQVLERVRGKIDLQQCVCSKGYTPSADGRSCKCGGYLSVSGDCVSECGDNQVIADEADARRCTCAAGYTQVDNGCECNGYVDVDGVSCVQTCEFAAHETEQRCVEECDSWYSRVEDGRCKEQTWRKSTAIAVQIVAVVAIAAVVLIIVLLARRKKTHARAPAANGQVEMTQGAERENVTGPEDHAE